MLDEPCGGILTVFFRFLFSHFKNKSLLEFLNAVLL